MTTDERCAGCPEPERRSEKLNAHQAEIASATKTIEEFDQQIQGCSVADRLLGKRALLESRQRSVMVDRGILEIRRMSLESNVAQIDTCEGAFIREVESADSGYETIEMTCGLVAQPFKRQILPYPKD